MSHIHFVMHKVVT